MRDLAGKDLEWADRIARGDRGAEEELFRTYYGPVRQMLRNRCRSDDIVDDLVQMTFLKLLRNLRRGALNDPAKLSAYCYSTARYTWLEHIGKRPPDEGSGPRSNVHMLESAEVAPPAEAHLESVEEGSLIRDLLGELPQPRDREVLRLYYLLERSKDEICTILDLSSSNFDSVIHRAKKRLRRLLERRQQGQSNERR